jgi:hypothetical protein
MEASRVFGGLVKQFNGLVNTVKQNWDECETVVLKPPG